MRKTILSLLLLLTIFSGCGNEQKAVDRIPEVSEIAIVERTEEVISEVTEGDFIYRLIADKKEYKVGEPYHIYAELEYIGDKEQETIYHAASPFYFTLTEKKSAVPISS